MSIRIKTPEQIEGIRKSCQLAADTLDHIEDLIKPGVTTQEINDACEAYIRKYDAIPAPLNYKGFPKAVCTSLNEVICHGIPGGDVLKEGDIINVDVTTILKGYYGDTSRMFAVGTVSEEALKLMSVTKDCLDIGIVQVRPGNKFGEIGRAITKYAKERGYSVVYNFCGHGVGIEFHEDPQVHHDDHQYDQREMKEGMIFTIEPMINCGKPGVIIDATDKWTARTVDGKLSAQYEHTVVVTEDGVEVLTK